MDICLSRTLCAEARRMAAIRVMSRRRNDALWRARAEKQLRLGLGFSDSIRPLKMSALDSISELRCEEDDDRGKQEHCKMEGAVEKDFRVGTELELEDTERDEADRVGTLLVRIGQLHGVGGVGMFSLAPNAIATLALEESSASIKDMDMETVSSKVRRTHQTSSRQEPLRAVC